MLSIGKLCAATGVKTPTIRYYEQIGLLPQPPRSRGNQRFYDRKALERLRFIRHSRELGFSLEAIRDLLSLSDNPDQSCAAADAIAKAQLVEVESRLARLMSLKTELERMVLQCAGDTISDCRVIEVLSDHAHCVTDHRTSDDAHPLAGGAQSLPAAAS
ncbi:MerR family transcriptional regulator [Paracoccus sediminis]|uniref:Cu(I)-responsive transcriptional regulator n=1 Tax=Paracoccus sediminis TaxID=1214787 RepID=A0A238UVC2_9RHOB|nr:helix-turn-helix domain-containing protein [Paracoccus sediminis]TBN52754.1 MerR family transcriptional regulator [Paracoccus sediminis]SNR26132.1 Cu(I)-responsive transcriptional regulator [Paracoccus sediminis]